MYICCIHASDARQVKKTVSRDFSPSNFFAKLSHQVSWLSCWSIFKYDIWLKSSNFDSALSVIPWSPKFSLTVKLDCFSSSMLRLCGVNDTVEFDSAVSVTPLSLTQRCQWLNRSSVSLILRRIFSNKKNFKSLRNIVKILNLYIQMIYVHAYWVQLSNWS